MRRPSQPSNDLAAANGASSMQEAPWELIHDDLFERIRSDDELDAAVTRLAAHTVTPFATLVRRMIGTELSEAEARSLFRRVLAHRRAMSDALGRVVDVRVAALDLLTASPDEPRRDSQPILVTPALLEKALEQATLDPLTRLPQRQHFMNLLRHELGQRNPRSVAVVFVDLDGFKEVNDRHGHASGDEVLRRLARVGSHTIRHADVLARIGGDEFALLLVEADGDIGRIAASVVERLRQRFETRTAGYGTSFSAGIAIAEPGETADDLLARADAAMYREKRARCDRR